MTIRSRGRTEREAYRKRANTTYGAEFIKKTNLHVKSCCVDKSTIGRLRLNVLRLAEALLQCKS